MRWAQRGLPIQGDFETIRQDKTKKKLSGGCVAEIKIILQSHHHPDSFPQARIFVLLSCLDWELDSSTARQLIIMYYVLFIIYYLNLVVSPAVQVHYPNILIIQTSSSRPRRICLPPPSARRPHTQPTSQRTCLLTSFPTAKTR